MAAIDAQRRKPINHPAPVRPDCPDMAHLGARARGGHRLVCTLPAKPARIALRRKRFSGRGQMREPVEMVGVDRAQIEDGHGSLPEFPGD